MSLFGGFGNTATQNAGASGTGTTGGGLFGASTTTQQPQQQQPSLFGATNTGGGLFGNNANTTTGGPAPLQSQATQPASAFGAPATTNNAAATTTTGTGGGLFGSTAGTGTTGGLFGQNNANNAGAGTGATTGGLFGQQQQQQPATGGGLFGNSTTNNTTGGGLFGNTNTNTTGTTGGLFGNTNTGTTGTTGGLFGNTANTNTGTTGGLFGNTNATTNTQQPATGGGLFGSTTTQPTTGGGLFGSTNTQTQTGGGLFGNNTANQGNNAGGGLFGAKPAGGGLFGSSTTTNTGGGLFGQQQQPQQQGGGLFGQSTTNAPSSSLFGSTLGTSALGPPSTGLGSSALKTALSSNQNASDPQTQFVKLTEKIEGIYNAWNPSSPQCRFQYPFYNLVDPSQVHLYGRPPNALNDAVWQKAVAENPDPTCFVPVIAIGFDDIRERVEAQSKQSTDQQQKLADLKTRLGNLATKHSVSNVARLQKASVGMTQIVHRLLKLIQRLHLLIPAVRASAIRPEEEALRGKLEEIEDDLRKGRVGAKVNELWALVGAVSAVVERGRGAGGEWAVVDEEGMAQIIQVLKEQQAGLAHLTKVLQKDKADMAVIMGQSGPTTEDGPAAEDEMLWNSTSTLRASALQ